VSLNAFTANAGVLIPVPPIPGSLLTLGFDINDDNIVTGFFLDASTGQAHSFYESLDGNYTAFDDSLGLAMPLTINNSGEIAGQTIVTDQGTCDVIPFERSSDGAIVHIRKRKKSLTGVAAGLNSKHQFVGYYCDKKGGISSYLGKLGKYKVPLTISGSPPVTVATGINKSGVVAGYFGAFGQWGGFLLQDEVTTVVNAPGANSTQLTDINDHGLAVGTATDSQSQTRAFVFDINSQEFTDADIADGVQSAGMNNAGLLILNVPSTFQSFVYCPRSKNECPGNGMEMNAGQTLPAPSPGIVNLRRRLLARFPGLLN
jgi:hypothetical protein